MKRKHNERSNATSRKKSKSEEKKILTANERERRKTSFYRAPTSEELSELRENENLYKNNLFRMQIQYLLDEVCIEEKKTKKMNVILHSLNEYLTSIKHSGNEQNLCAPDCMPNDVKLPIPNLIPLSKLKGKFQFLPPKETKVIGSYLLQTTIKPNGCVDVAVQIPKECFQGRDFLNYRYHFKRAVYLAWIAKCLKKWEHTEKLTFATHLNVYKPCLLIRLKGKLGKCFSIKLHLAIPEGVFKLNRFAPLKNNVRSNWYDGFEESITEESDFPTPYYNTSVLCDMLYESHLQMIYTALKECPAIKEAACLFKVWSRQRSFGGCSTFNGFVGSMLMVYLLSARKISSHMSSYQIFRQVLNFLWTRDLTKDGISLCKDESLEATVNDFHGRFDVVFVDPSGYLNLCADVSKVTYETIQYEAHTSLYILDHVTHNGFDGLFIQCRNFLQTCDHAFELSKLEDFKTKLLASEEHKPDVIDSGGDWSLLLPKLVVSTLKQGLDKRVHRIIQKPRELKEWEISSTASSIIDTTFEFGLHLNTEFSDNVLIMGPPADQPEAKEFRLFWGSKSELRRFQDGSINEAVLWQCSNVEEKKMICKRIAEHLLKIHHQIPVSSMTYIGDELNCLLKPKFLFDSKIKRQYGCGEEESLNFIKTFDELCKQIRQLDDLPLKVNSIHGIDPAFRMTEVFSPTQFKQKKTDPLKDHIILPKLGKKCPAWCPAYNALIQFETSGKWPDDIKAIQYIKSAFHIKIAESLRDHYNMKTQSTPKFVDIIKNGYVFRITVVHYREMILHKEMNISGFLKKEHDTASHKLDVLIVKKPLHNTLIHSLNSRFHAYALTARLCKRWISSQMLSSYISDEAVELITAFLFLGSLQAPCSPMSGFLSFLDCLWKFDWENEPMVVNLNDQITSEEYIVIQETFTSNRPQLPAMCISTSYDKFESIWTKVNPTKQICRRISMLSEAALKLLGNDVCHFTTNTIKQIFRPTLSDYDAVIELDKDQVPKYYQFLDTTIQPKPPSIKHAVNSLLLPVVDFDPARLFLKELQHAFSDVALFFYDECGGMNIGVVWKSSVHQLQPFKVLHAQYKKVVEEKKHKKKKSVLDASENKMQVNIPAIITDFYMMGKGLVTNVKEK